MNRFSIRRSLKRSNSIVILLIFTSRAWSQMEHNLFNLDYSPQSQWVNPALKPNTKWHFGVGTLFNSSWPLSYNDIVSRRNNDTVYINGDNILSKLGTHNHFSLGVIPDISFGFGIRKGYLSFGIKENIIMNFSAPKDVFDFVIKGNGDASTMGQFQNIGDFRVNGTHYREFFAGGSYQMNPTWTVGARLKLLMGYENIHTVKSDLSIKTDPNDYSLTFRSNYLINVSGLDSNFSDKYRNGPFIGSGNTGFGIDLGASYKLNDKISFTGSILDLGFINWSSNNKSFKTKNENASYEYSGIDLYNLSSTSENNYLENILDTIRTRFDIEEVNTSESYSTSLYSKLYLGGQYKLNERFQFGALSSFTLVNSSLLPSLSLYAKTNLYKICQAQLSYQMNQNAFTNLGMGLVLNLGPLQYYLMSDNIIGSAFAPLSSKNVSFRTGFNIQWSYGKRNESKTENNTIKKVKPVDTLDLSFANDLDRDSVKDEEDYCPEIVGSTMNSGCPVGMDLSRIKNNELLIFQSSKIDLTPLSKLTLDKLASSLQVNQKARLILQVRSTDEEVKLDNQLGVSRAKGLYDFFVSKGLIDRVTIFNKNASEPLNSVDAIFNRSAEVNLVNPH